MLDLGGLQNPQKCHWSDEFQKAAFFSEIVLPDFWGPWLPSKLFN